MGTSTFTRLEIDDGSMSMWMILRGTWREMRRIADHAVVEARADRQQHVAVLHRHVGFVGAVHAQHAEELPVGGRDSRPGPSGCWCTGSPAAAPAWSAAPARPTGSRRRPL